MADEWATLRAEMRACRRCLEAGYDIAAGAVFLLNRQDFFVGALAEQVFEFAVEFVLMVKGGVSRLAFVENLNRHFVIHRILKFIFVDVSAKPQPSSPAAMSLLNQRRSGESDTGRFRKSLEQIVADAAGIVGLCPMSFVNHQ